jgi:iron(III) transport system substrate-binding protein
VTVQPRLKMAANRRRKPVLVFSATLAAAGALLGCGNPSGAAAASIVLYNGQHPQLTDKLVAAFTDQTGIQVSVRTNDGIVLADQILQEGGASPADVYLTENSPELMFLQQRGLLSKLSTTVLNQVPARDSSPTGRWVGVGLRVSSLVYDPTVVRSSALPPSILDLAQQKWEGKVAVAPIDSDFPPLVGAIIATYGKAVAARWLAGIRRNAHVYQDEEAVVAAVNRGDVSLGIANQYYWYRLRLEVGRSAMHSTLYFFPHHDVGSIENVSGAAVLASSHHQREALAFVRFIVSPAGQRIIAASDDFEYPARPGVVPNKALPPLTAIAPATIGVAALGDDQLASQLIQQAGLA